MPRFAVSLLVLLLLSPLAHAAKRRAAGHPSGLTPEGIIAIARRVADRVTWTYHPRLHWENAVYFDGIVLFGEQLELRQAGSGRKYYDLASWVILNGDDPIETVYWGDGTAYGQAAMDLHRLLATGDARREQLLTKLEGPMRFAEHAMRANAATAAPREPWWTPSGYGARYWQDDLYMVAPWLAMYGASGNELARNLAYEWIESYLYDHRDGDIPSMRARNGLLLWDPDHGLLQHEPAYIGSSEFFWGRGNGWALVALMRAAEALDAPYTGGRYERVVTRDEIREMLRAAAASVITRRASDGGWGSHLSFPEKCGGSETSATALMTFFLARGVNEGWLEREVYTPVIHRAFALLMNRVDAQGIVSGIQPPDIGPGCGMTTSAGAVNVNYGPGALLLATAEVLRMIQ
ncbi:MAG: glycoside hydrolase family 88 protein [Acidobacteriota bacterium]|nr:glycoside hydrolase family 88 protein [Acidobacteriota bacterium]